ncbi:1385_t:CDS:10, partial [Dentiscutata heterogama]
NMMTSMMISSLQQISHLESTIAGIPGTLSALESEIKLKAQEFKQLSNIRQMPLAYAMTLIEILRRSEYTKLFLSKAQQLAEAMANFRNLEQKRRDNYRLDVKSYIPLNISALDDNPPMCEVSTLNIKDDRLPSFSKADIKTFFDLLEKIRPIILSQASLFKSQIVASSSLFKTRDQQTIQQTVIDILSTLHSKSVKSYSQIEKMDLEFDKIVEKSFHFERSDFDKNNTLSRRSLAPPSPQMGRRSSRSSRQSFSEDSGSTLGNTTDRLLLETLKELDRSKETTKKYEARIKKLEDLLHTNYQASKNSTMLSNTRKIDSKFSVSAVEQELEKNSLQEKYNELQNQYNLSSTRCNELETKVTELEKVNQAHENYIVETNNEKSNQLEEFQNRVNELNQTLLSEKSEKKMLSDKYDDRIQELESLLRESNRKNADLEKELEVLKTDNEHVKKEKDAAEAETFTLDSKINSILAENNKLKGLLEDSQKQNEEREKLHKQELDQLQKQSDEKLQEIEGWKQNLEMMNSAREDLEQDLAKSREKIKSIEQDYNERTKTFATTEKLIKDISETINEYMFIVTSNESSNSEQSFIIRKHLFAEYSILLAEKTISNDNLDPIIMIRKMGNAAKYLDQKLCETSQSLDASTNLKTELENSLTELRRELQERTEFSKGLSKSLWEYYSSLRTLMKTMELKIPTLADNYVMSVTSISQNVDDNKTGLSDSCYTEDLSKFFLNDNSDEQSFWPKEKYETLLSLTMKVKLDEVRDLIVRALKDAESLRNRFQEESKSCRAREESKDKIVFQNFKNKDVVLFFPCNPSPKKTYMAFNHNCPYYYLSDTETIKNKDYIMGRIIKISNHIAEAENNPFELQIGVKYYTVDIDENWQNVTNSFHSRRYSVNTTDTITRSPRSHKSHSLPSRSLSSSVIMSND